MLDNEETTMTWDEETVNSAIIINGFAASQAVAAAVLAPTIIGDEVALTALTAAMILSIGKGVFKKPLFRGVVLAWLGRNIGIYLGSRALAMTVKWIPGVGSSANATIAFFVTQAVGWTVFLIFKDDKNLDELSSEEVKEYQRRAKKMEKPDVKKWISRITPDEKEEYETLVKKLKNKDLSDNERDSIVERMQVLIKPHAY